jgi:hypothetical protein
VKNPSASPLLPETSRGTGVPSGHLLFTLIQEGLALTGEGKRSEVAVIWNGVGEGKNHASEVDEGLAVSEGPFAANLEAKTHLFILRLLYYTIQ